MPYLDGKGDPISVKKFANQRGHLTELLKKVRTPTTPA